MKRALHELSEVERNKALEGLTIPVGEFGAMLSAALMTLALLFAPATFVTTARNVVVTTVANASSAVSQIVTIGSRMTARAAEQNGASLSRAVR
jgi:hypothetical protein